MGSIPPPAISQSIPASDVSATNHPGGPRGATRRAAGSARTRSDLAFMACPRRIDPAIALRPPSSNLECLFLSPSRSVSSSARGRNCLRRRNAQKLLVQSASHLPKEIDSFAERAGRLPVGPWNRPHPPCEQPHPPGVVPVKSIRLLAPPPGRLAGVNCVSRSAPGAAGDGAAQNLLDHVRISGGNIAANPTWPIAPVGHFPPRPGQKATG